MLEEVDIFVPKNERFYSHFAAYDLEVMMKHVEYTQNNKLKWLSKHIPFCVGICSNIPGYKEPYVYIKDDMDDLVTNMISFLNKISNKSNMLCKQKWGYVFSKLDERQQQWIDIMSKCEKGLEYIQLNESEEYLCSTESNIADTISGYYDTEKQCVIYEKSLNDNFNLFDKARKASIMKSSKYAIESVKSLKLKFELYISKLPVLCFCSSNYDTVLISKKLAMKMELDKFYVIKKNIYIFMYGK